MATLRDSSMRIVDSIFPRECDICTHQAHALNFWSMHPERMWINVRCKDDPHKPEPVDWIAASIDYVVPIVHPSIADEQTIVCLEIAFSSLVLA